MGPDAPASQWEWRDEWKKRTETDMNGEIVVSQTPTDPDPLDPQSVRWREKKGNEINRDGIGINVPVENGRNIRSDVDIVSTQSQRDARWRWDGMRKEGNILMNANLRKVGDLEEVGRDLDLLAQFARMRTLLESAELNASELVVERCH